MFNLIKRCINFAQRKKNSENFISYNTNISNKHKGAIENQLTPLEKTHLYKDYMSGIKSNVIQRKYHIGANHYHRIIKALGFHINNDMGGSTLIMPTQYLIRIDYILNNFKPKSVPSQYAYLYKHINKSLKSIIHVPKNFNEPLLPIIKTFIRTRTQISTSKIQRKYHIGYNRAANIMNYLTIHHFVSRRNGAKPRNVLFNKRPISKNVTNDKNNKHLTKKSKKITDDDKDNKHLVEFYLMKYSIKPMSYIFHKYIRHQAIPSSYLASYSILKKNSQILPHMNTILRSFSFRKHIYSINSWKCITSFGIQRVIIQYRKAVYRAIFDNKFLHMPLVRASRLNYLTESSVFNYLHMPYVINEYKSKFDKLKAENAHSVQLKFKNL